MTDRYPVSAFLVLCCMLASYCATAQDHRPGQDLQAFEVSGLTADMRDAVTRMGRSELGLELAYACVPAGVIAFKQATDPREDVALWLNRKITGLDRAAIVRPLNISMEALMDKCATERER